MRPMSLLLVLCLISVPLFAANHVELFTAGKAALSSGKAEKAAELFEQAIKLQPKNAEYHYYLGGAYGEMAMAASLFGKASLAKKAKVALDKAVELDPNAIEPRFALDRKSTRLNSSHLVISYAVFCLKKKKPKHGFCITK